MMTSNTRSFSNASNPGFQCHESVILLPFGRESYLQEMLRLLEAKEVPMDPSTDRMVYEFRIGQQSFTLVYCGMGAPATVNALEMIRANGGRRVVLFGACGGVAADLKVGELVIPAGAVRGEGASHYYAPDPFPAVCDVDLTFRLRETSRQQGCAYKSGIVFTTDASYRQGDNIYKDYEGLVVAVECECSAAAVAGIELGLQIGALFFCTDNVVSENEDDKSYRSLEHPDIKRAFESGLEVATRTLMQYV